MRKFARITGPVLVILGGLFLASCSSPTQLPADVNRALETYWGSLPSDPNLTYQILEAWPGVVPVESVGPSDPDSDMEVWCVETEIATATDATIVGATVTWIAVRSSPETAWTVAMLATMSSTWPYEACGQGP